MRENYKNLSYLKRIAVLLALIASLVMLGIAGLAGSHATFAVPHADDGKTLTIHVYDTAQEYNTLAAWVWLKGEDGVEYRMSTSAAPDEGFLKEYELNGQTVTNRAYTVTASFTAAQLSRATAIGFLICKQTGGSGDKFWDRYVKETADVFLDVKLFDGTNTLDVYYIRKDTVAYTNLEEAKMALEKVLSARFISRSAIEFEVTSPLTTSTPVVLLDGGVEKMTVNARPDDDNPFKGTAAFTNLDFDYAADYSIKVGLIPTPAPVSKAALLDDVGFIEAYETTEVQNNEYGAIYSPEKTVFRLWAPFASSVNVMFYNNGTSGDPSYGMPMKKVIDGGTGKWSGVWEYERQGDCHGLYYTYVINNGGVEVETIDPYARACGLNGLRGMVVSMDKVNPDGWANDSFLYNLNADNADVPIIWELHVRDFSSSADSGMVNKGKYLAFTEKGTTVPGTDIKTGVDYLKDLGITYVHLNPVYDFGSIDESITTDIYNKDKFNWGYDPQNYNIPEGSYSSDPTDGSARVNEFKQMVMALHEAGIGVIMDVVYNHTYSTANLPLGDAVPGYFYRTNVNGDYTDGSGCGNEIASERSMVRKYMVDSVLYWAQEYHIDGFRFDLMGVHDLITMNTIRAELDKLDNNNGRKLLMYGEPWTGDGVDSGRTEGGEFIKYSYHTRVNATSTEVAGTGKYTKNAGNKLVVDSYYGGSIRDLDSRIAVFDGYGRDGVRGGSWDIDARQDGWIQGNTGKAGDVRGMLCGSNMGMSQASQSVAYASVHDNFTLYDHLIGKSSGKETMLSYNVPIDYYMTMQNTVSAICLMSRGMSLMIAGEEMSRTKYGNHNSYNSPIKLNQIEWSRQESFAKVHDHYKKLIAVRKAYKDIFSYTTAQDRDAISITVSGNGVITQTFSKNGVTLKAVYNSGGSATSVSTAGYKVYVANGNVTNAFSGSLASKCCVVFGTLEV
ncbi:MAG: hypothetical protein J1F33_07805 [Clostridiales bacterium]|nr:hypothetical protein [Clostridiales bacterium]